MPPRPRPHHGSGDPPDDPPPSRRPHPGPSGDHPASIAQAERAAAQIAAHGRAKATGGAGPTGSPGRAIPLSPDDIELSRWEETHGKLGAGPRKFNVDVNDDAHRGLNAHTRRDHGPQLPLRSQPGVKTVEGRIYGDYGWPQPASGSHRWTDASTMNRTINDYVSKNWELIRNDLAIRGTHRAVFDAGHRVGEGFVNRGMGGAGPRQAQFTTTSVVRILIRLVPGSDPPEPFIVTAFPSALG